LNVEKTACKDSSDRAGGHDRHPLKRESRMFETRRRDFITLLGGATMAWPPAARAQPAMPAVGLIRTTSPDDFGGGANRVVNDKAVIKNAVSLNPRRTP
jgi:hypothetical protein